MGAFALGGRKSDPSRPNVILIVIDTLRRDHVGAYGYPRSTTPAVDGLAGDGVLFAEAYANSNWTKPSVTSILSGLYVSQHGVKYELVSGTGEALSTQKLPDDIVTLAESMQAAGYLTMGIVENVHISGKLGFNQGFSVWNDRPYGATNVTNAFLEEYGKVREPFFAYIHYFDPHAPYSRTRNFEQAGGLAPGVQEAKSTDYSWSTYTFGVDRGIVGMSSIERERVIDLYDGEIRYVDTGIARILKTLKSRGMYDNTWVIVTSDHGENFGEGGRLTHPHDSFAASQVRVPLIMKMPKALAVREVVVADRVEHVDLSPTILRYIGARPPVGAMGRDLLPAMVRRAMLPTKSVVGESESGKMLIAERYKYVSVPTELGEFRFLYDQSADPLEERNLAPGDVATAQRMAETASAVERDALERRKVDAAASVELSSEEIERMRAVGYLHN